MPRISTRYLHKNIEEHLCNLLWDYFAKLNNRESVVEFIQSLLSRTEQIMIAKRLAIAVLLSRGYTFDTIDDKLKVSKATIAGIQHQMSSGGIGYKKAVEIIEKSLKKAELGDNIEEFLLSISLPARYGSTRHTIKSEIGKELYKHRKQREVF